MLTRDHLKELIQRCIKPTCALTAAFNETVTLELAKQRLKQWHARVDRFRLGPRWNRTPVERRLLVVWFPEHLSSNVHWHGLASITIGLHHSELLDYMKTAWRRVVAGGTFHAQLMYDDKAIDYGTKDFQKYYEFVISTEFATCSRKST